MAPALRLPLSWPSGLDDSARLRPGKARFRRGVLLDAMRFTVHQNTVRCTWLQRLSPAAVVSSLSRQSASPSLDLPNPLTDECAYTNDFRERKQTVVRAGEGAGGQ